MTVLYITAQTPYGKGETFIMQELLELKRLGLHVVIFPRNPPRDTFHKNVEPILSETIWLPLINARMIGYFIYTFLRNRELREVCLRIIRHSQTFLIQIKNLAVVPKATFITWWMRNHRIDHVHAHWGSTTSTMAYVISEIAKIPWSFTVHRWDIVENNLLKFKCQSARFTRCISSIGKSEVIHLVGHQIEDKIKIIHMGVKVQHGRACFQKECTEFIIACPANLRKVKGHYYLLEACRILVDAKITNFCCLIIGDGPLRKRLSNQIKILGIAAHVRMLGRIPHEELMRMYDRKEVNVVILPSIIDEKGEKEGIPVALMEAMSYGIPVISTNTGGIAELIRKGAGMLIEQKNSLAIAEAIRLLISNAKIAQEIGEVGYSVVNDGFNIEKVAGELINAFHE